MKSFLVGLVLFYGLLFTGFSLNQEVDGGSLEEQNTAIIYGTVHEQYGCQYIKDTIVIGHNFETGICYTVHGQMFYSFNSCGGNNGPLINAFRVFDCP